MKNYINNGNDIDSIYMNMKNELQIRCDLQQRERDLWDYILRTRSNQERKMKEITTEIGSSTHRINLLISELCKYKRTHKAMNLANAYLTKEINRLDKIIAKQKNVRYKVNTGKSYLVNVKGDTTTSTKYVSLYIDKKTEQVNRLRKWQANIINYIE